MSPAIALCRAADERLDGGDRERGVEALVPAVQRQVLVVVGAGEPAHRDQLPADGEPLLGERELLALERDRRAAWPRRRRAARASAAGSCRADTTAAPSLMIPAFTVGDLGDRLAEPVGVVDVDRREHRDVAVGGVGRVPRAAHADLEHEHVDRRIGEGDEGEHGQQLEERQRRVVRRHELGVDEVDERRDLVPRVGDRGIGDRLAVDHDALGEPLQVRAREQAGAQAVRAQQALDDAARRRLAVRAGDVDDAVGALRVVEQLEHAARALDARLHPALALALQQRRVDGVGAIAVTIAHSRRLRSA